MYAVYYWPFSSAATPPTPPAVTHKGWVGRRRTIRVEQLREILKAQGSPWADELADTYQEAEKRLASPKISEKHEEVIERVLRRVVELAPTPAMDWGPALRYLQVANTATRTTLAIKHAKAALRLLEEEEDDDEEAILLMMMN